MTTTLPRHAAPTTSARPAVLATLFYGGLALLMLAILTQTLTWVLPDDVARRVGFNSEGYTLALLLAAYIQLVLPRLRDATRWPVAMLVAGICFAAALGLYGSDLPSRFKTLNEALFALALVLPYVTLRRPLGRWPGVVSAALLAAVVLGVVTNPAESPAVLLAETFAVLVLAPLAFDVVDRGILDPAAVTSRALRLTWYAVLVAVPLVVVALGTDVRTGGGWHAVLEYLGRTHEGVIGLLLVQLYLAVGLGRTGRRAG